jgi:hypothetical protein
MKINLAEDVLICIGLIFVSVVMSLFVWLAAGSSKRAAEEGTSSACCKCVCAEE